MTYKYVCPTTQGAQRVDFSYQDHQQLFPNLRQSILVEYEYFLCENCILIHRYDSAIVMAIEAMVMPINLIMIGLANFNEFKSHYRSVFDQKKHGAFVTTMYMRRDFNDFSLVENAAIKETQCL